MATMVAAAPVCAADDTVSASLSGVTNTIAQQGALDSVSHHLDTLRMRIKRPTPCTVDKCGPKMPAKRNDAWMVYTGGYDSVSSQAGMGKYSRTWNGLLLGVDRQLCCCATLGVAFGYENSISRSTATKFDTDTYYIDLYSAIRTGKYDHKLTLGVGILNYDTHRGIRTDESDVIRDVTATGSMNGHTVNVGYELSRDYVVERWDGVATPFMSVNYAYIDIDNLRENGAGDAGLKTDFDSMNLLQIGLGVRYTMEFRGLPRQERSTLSLSAAAVCEFSDHRPDAVNQFYGRDDTFGTRSLKRAPFFGQFGMTAEVPLSPSWDLLAGGYGRVGAKRGSVTGNIGLGYEF